MKENQVDIFFADEDATAPPERQLRITRVGERLFIDAYDYEETFTELHYKRDEKGSFTINIKTFLAGLGTLGLDSGDDIFPIAFAYPKKGEKDENN